MRAVWKKAFLIFVGLNSHLAASGSWEMMRDRDDQNYFYPQLVTTAAGH
jgi:hypothetical protein